MDYSNVDLKSSEINANLINAYSFNTLLLEIECNCREISEESIKKQFEEHIKASIICAKEIFADNLQNILAHAKEYREMK